MGENLLQSYLQSCPNVQSITFHLPPTILQNHPWSVFLNDLSDSTLRDLLYFKSIRVEAFGDRLSHRSKRSFETIDQFWSGLVPNFL